MKLVEIHSFSNADRERLRLLGSVLCLLSLVLFSASTIYYITNYGTMISAALIVEPRFSKRNVIFMVSDGFGPASETMARQFLLNVTPAGRQMRTAKLPLDSILVGQSRTHSYDSLITDSAAGATAFSCGLKSYNGGIAVNGTQAPCATISQLAKLSGYHTGLVVTSRVTHATPGAFSAHVIDRDYESEIAYQQSGYHPFGRSMDLMFGGGRSYFIPASTKGSKREDELDLLGEMAEDSVNVITTRREFDGLRRVDATSLPIVGLFADSHMSYEIDRDAAVEPSLLEMTQKALSMLSASSGDSNGFFLLIEGSKIDMAAHNNDGPAHLKEILMYQETVAFVKQFVDRNPGTVMISVSDHETGGLALGRQIKKAYPEYRWFPKVLSKVVSSAESLAASILSYAPNDRPAFVQNVIFPIKMGIDDFTKKNVKKVSDSENFQDIVYYLADMISLRAEIGWSTHGHTAVDVNLYAYAGREYASLLNPIRGSVDNTELTEFMASWLDLPFDYLSDLSKVLVAARDNGTLVVAPKSHPHEWEEADNFHLQ